MIHQGLRSHSAAALAALTRRFGSSETAVMMTLAIVVGIGGGLGAIVFIEMIKFFEGIFFGGGSQILGFLGKAYVIVVPLLGALLVGPLVHFVAPEAKGHGVPQVLTAIALRGGRIRPVVVLAKALGSAITIGSGGSVGREGPIVQIGSALGSTIGQAFKLNERRVINLVASGAAAGIAATFNAPIAGVMFALEVILGEFGIQTFSTIVISAVTASVVSRVVLGDSPAFAMPAYALKSPWELVLYLGLGVAAACAAFAFVKVLHWFEDTFDHWQFPPYLKPAVGGLALGLLGFAIPQVFGTGFTTIESALNGQVGLTLLVVFVFAKILATSLTLGSGSSGGVFAPALFIGAVLGGAYGQLAHLAFPGIVAANGAYAMVGMAAVFAAAARAPITAIIILFEMTQDYRIILPLMFATVISTALAGWFEPESIYTFKLKRRGIDVRAKKDTNLMRGILVQEAMTPLAQIATVTPDMVLSELARLFQETGHHGFLVLNPAGELYGVVTLADLERSLTSGGTAATVADICTTDVLTAFYDETLDDALRHFGALDVGRIPVVARQHPRQVVGVLRRGDIVHAYSHALVDKNQREHLMERLRLESQIGVKLVQEDLSTGDTTVGKSLKEIGLPADCVIVSIYRGGRVVVPRGDTQLLPGDRVTALAGASAADSLREALHTGGTVQVSDGGGDIPSAVGAVDVLEELLVREVMETDTATLRESDALATAAEVFARTHHHGLPVVDAAGDLVGILTVQDLERAQTGNTTLTTVGQACTRDLLVTYPDESLGVALRQMSGRNVGRLPVVARDDPRRLLGVLRRADVVRAYEIALEQHAARRHRAQLGRLDAVTDAEISVQEVTVMPGAACAGQRIGQVGWPRDAVIASLRRGSTILVPHGDTLLQAGDVLVVVAEGEAAEEARRLCGSV